MVDAVIVGATGYAGIELTRLLHNHPQIKSLKLISQSNDGVPISSIYPNLRGYLDIECLPFDLQAVDKNAVAFVSLPHGASSDTVKKLIDRGLRVIDLSGDFRYKSHQVYEKWYKIKHPYPEMLASSVYGLPELYRKSIKNAVLLANPGCYTTCSILGLAPLISKKIISNKTIVIDAKSGASGAGRSLSLGMHFCEANETIKAYNVTTHRHTSEIEQELSFIAGEEINLSFTPHLLPINRGILCSIYAQLNENTSHEEVYKLYSEFYADEPFVRLHNEGSLPEVKFVAGSNTCHIGFAIDKRLNRIIVICALDNLIKGAGGQAIQNMNIMCGFSETDGLSSPGWYF